ncbi:MAG: amino acid permease [bacterium]
MSEGRSMGLLEATGVGVGAIVGGGILALAGVAYKTTGPSAILAFALNGLIAVLTAFSFAEMSCAFPESGGTYTFAKKVLSVEAAFMVGWVVWFASIVACVLYAIGFASYGVIVFERLWRAVLGTAPNWLIGRPMTVTLAIGATTLYTVSLIRKSTGQGQWPTIGKVIVFAILIASGFWALCGRSAGSVAAGLSPFFAGGAMGLFQAMGYTFIALQGFDLIAAVAGEVRDPGRTIPRAMFLSLVLALAIYLPLLFVVATVGVEPGHSITVACAGHPEIIIAVAAQRYMGPIGYWLVMVAAILSMLSALHANIFAASRVALAMAGDRTLPPLIGIVSERRGTPLAAILASAVAVTVILLMVPDVAAAGAASSLIFLLSFALVHWMSILARRRGCEHRVTFRVPWFPVIQVTGAFACAVLAIFQGMAVPSARSIILVWLCLGGILFLTLFSSRARVADALAEAQDPTLVQLRGRSPLILVPIANPANAQAMVAVANALAPSEAGRVLLLSVVNAPDVWKQGEYPQQLLDAQAVLRESLAASFAAGLFPEALTTIAPQPWPEISRVSRTYHCESLLLGFSNLTEHTVEIHLEEIISTVDCDVVVLRASGGWLLSDVQRVLVPVGGRNEHNELRARLLGSLCRSRDLEVTFLRILPKHESRKVRKKAWRDLTRLAQDETPGYPHVKVIHSSTVAEEVARHARENDLIILGLQRINRRHKVFGHIPLSIAASTTCPIIMISRRG